MVLEQNNNTTFVEWFRNSSPYINAFRGRTFVICFGGEMVADAGFAHLIHDIALLNSLGVKLVLVHGARPQIEQRLQQDGIQLNYCDGIRITDQQALPCVTQAVGSVRVEVEALLSMGLANSPMAGARLRVSSGNFVTAQPLGVRDGVDFQHTGEVRRVDTEAINQQLALNNIVLLSPLGYSATGEVFNISAEEVAEKAAIALKAHKLIYLGQIQPLLDVLDSERELYQQQIEQLKGLPEDVGRTLKHVSWAISKGVPRCHLIEQGLDGSLLLELFTRDGCGVLITAEQFEGLRQAGIDDVGGIIELIAPLEEAGILVRRSRELLEMEIDYFHILERDKAIIGCAALYPYEEAIGELACLAVSQGYKGEGRGDVLLEYIEKQAQRQGLKKLFVLTTRTAHWFQERGFKEGAIADLPVEKQAMYNLQRNSKVFIKEL